MHLPVVRWWRLLLIWAVLLPIAAVALNSMIGLRWKRILELRNSGRLVTGVIVAIEPGNHQSVTYQFHVGSTAYEGKQYMHQLSVGTEVPIFYLPRDPRVSSITDPSQLLQEYAGGLFFGSAALSFVVAFGLYREFAADRAPTND
jgi:hypothetical protein